MGIDESRSDGGIPSGFAYERRGIGNAKIRRRFRKRVCLADLDGRAKGISDGWGGEGAEKEERDLVIPGNMALLGSRGVDSRS